MAPAIPTIRVLIDFASVWNHTPPIFTELQAVTHELQIRRGRQFERDAVQSGRLTLTLDNAAGDLWPDTSGGTPTRQIRPGLQTRVEAEWQNVVYPLFTGFIESWEPSVTPGQSIVIVTAYDGLKLLATRQLETAGYAQALSGARIGQILDEIEWPAGARQLDAGQMTVTASGALDRVAAREHLNQVLTAEQGYSFIDGAGRFVFHDRAARTVGGAAHAVFGPETRGAVPALPFADPVFEMTDVRVVNDASVTRIDGTPQTAKHKPSQESYGVRSETLNNLPLTSDLEARSLAQYRVSQWAQPGMRLRAITLRPEANPAAMYPQALGREIGDRVTVRWPPAGIDADFYIEGIQHRRRAHTGWTTQWWLSPTSTLTYWRLGIVGASELGQTTRLSF